MKFTEEDKLKVIKFLNLNANSAKLTLDTKELVEYFKLLNYMQTTLLPKIDANIMEVTKIIENKEE